MRLNKLIEKVTAAYDNYEFYLIYHAIHNFCVVDLSNFYLDVIKDRTYCEKQDSAKRRSSQSAMYIILDALVRLIAPILSFTAEEIWGFMPHAEGSGAKSVFLTDMPVADKAFYDEALEEKWSKILMLRDDAAKALEIARTNKVIGHSLGADVTVYADSKNYDFIKGIEGDLAEIFITSSASVKTDAEAPSEAYKAENLAGVSITVSVPKGEKCERCWMYSETTGSHKEGLCDRCASVID